MRRDDKYRFSLSWGRDTAEKIAVGDLLEKLKNRKSDLIVQAVWEYIGNHPEVMAENAKIVITVQSTPTDEQTLAKIQQMIDASVERLKDSMKFQIQQESRWSRWLQPYLIRRIWTICSTISLYSTSNCGQPYAFKRRGAVFCGKNDGGKREEVKTKWSSRKASYCTLTNRRAAPHISSGYVACMESRTSRPGHDPNREGRTGGSRMLCADKLWRLGGHDPYSLIMIRRFGRDPSGSQSVAGCGKCQQLRE